jgi:Ca2+-binding RTX toxin-like protein
MTLIAGLLLLLPAAAHASKFDIYLSNDIANRTGPGYPKVALGVRGATKDTNWKCWDDGDLWAPQDHAVSPGGQTRLYTDVQNCYFGYRDVQLSIQESSSAPWVVMDGQDNFRLYFGNETDVGRSGVERCERNAGGSNCFFISGMPNTWATRPLGTGLMCMVVTKFAQSTAASMDANREDTAYISVRDDGACNIPRGARSWPRNSGTPVQAGYPVMGPTERVPATITRSPNQAAPATPPDPTPPAEVLGTAVRSILSGARIVCGWGVRGSLSDTCNAAGADSAAYSLTGLTIPGALPPDNRPPNFKITNELQRGDPYNMVGKNDVALMPADPKTALNAQTNYQYGRRESGKDSFAKKFGFKQGVEFAFENSFNLFFISKFDQKTKVSVDTSQEISWASETGYENSNMQSLTGGATVNAEPGRYTKLVVYQTKLASDFQYSADIQFGVDGKGEPVGNPAAHALGMSPSASQGCAAIAIGDSSVTGSFMEFAKRRFDTGDLGPEAAATESERALYDSLANFYVGGRRCPGYPAGFASLAGVRGTGAGSFNSDGEGQTPIMNPKTGKQEVTDDGTPRYMNTPALAQTTCVFSRPYPNATATGTATAMSGSGVPCAEITTQATGPQASTVQQPGTLATLTSGDDAYPGSPASELVDPGAGNDVVRTGAGALNIVNASAGNDTLIGGAGADHLDGGPGNDTISGGPGVFWLIGGTGNDRITQRGGRGSIWGGAGRDTIDVTGAEGGFGADAGNDQLIASGDLRRAVLGGGTGNDSYRIAAGKGCANVFELPGQGTDTVRTARCLSHLANVERITVTGTAPVSITAGEGNQVVTGNSAANRLAGGLGADVMNGGDGDDTIMLGSDRYDTATGGSGADRFVPGGRGATSYHVRLAPNATAHRLTDFNAAEGDRIVLTPEAFGREVRSLRRAFRVVSTPDPQPTVALPTLLHDPRTGLVAFDRDGTGIRGPRVIAMVPVGTVITPDMFEIR